MNRREALELLLGRMNHLRMNNGFFGATDGTIGNINLLQKDMNQALAAWQETGDTTGLARLTRLLQAYGNLTDTEYEQIMEAIDGET